MDSYLKGLFFHFVRLDFVGALETNVDGLIVLDTNVTDVGLFGIAVYFYFI